MRNRNLKPLLLGLGLSALVHGGLLWVAPASPRPAARPRNGEPRVSLVNIPLPAPPRPASPPPPAPSESPAPRAPAEAPEETARTEAGEERPDAEEGGFPGTPVPVFYADPALREDAVSRYLAMIRGLIDQGKEYPYQARRQEQEGTVLIRFTLSRQGRLVGEPVMEKKSRHERLNASAIEAVKNAAPYPSFPPEIDEDEMSFQVAVSFSLK